MLGDPTAVFKPGGVDVRPARPAVDDVAAASFVDWTQPRVLKRTGRGSASSNQNISIPASKYLRCDSSPRNVRRGRGVAPTRLHGTSASQPRRRRDSSPRNIRVAAAAVPRFIKGRSATRPRRRRDLPNTSLGHGGRYPRFTFSQTARRVSGKNGSSIAPPGAGEHRAGAPVAASRANSPACVVTNRSAGRPGASRRRRGHDMDRPRDT